VGRKNSPKSVGYNIQSDEHHDAPATKTFVSLAITRGRVSLATFFFYHLEVPAAATALQHHPVYLMPGRAQSVSVRKVFKDRDGTKVHLSAFG
jgi:hypothetical protein